MRWLFVSLTIVTVLALCWAQKDEEQKTLLSQLTFAVEGLRCERCVTNLTKALKSASGVHKAEVLLKDKRAIVVLDESKVPVSDLIAQTHKQVPYRLALLLPIEDWEKADQNKAVQVVKELKGISDVKADKLGLLVSFDTKVTVRYNELTEALAKADFKVLNSPASSTNQERNDQSKSQGQCGSHKNSCCSESKSCQGDSHSGCKGCGCH